MEIAMEIHQKFKNNVLLGIVAMLQILLIQITNVNNSKKVV